MRRQVVTRLIFTAANRQLSAQYARQRKWGNECAVIWGDLRALTTEHNKQTIKSNPFQHVQ
jgi:hypothetical protein